VNTSTQSSIAVSLTTVLIPLALLSGCGSTPEDENPLPDAVGGWMAGEPSEYLGEDLFVYINGGAEIYYEHGFERIDIREYTDGDKTVSVEIYTMAGTAYGIYSYARSQSGRPIALGAGGTITDYYLHFWAGRHLAAVTSHFDGPGVAAAVEEIGRGIAKNLGTAGDVPQLMGILPVDRCETGTEMYLAGPIGLNVTAPIAAELFEGFAEGATMACGSARLVALRWDTADLAAEALQQAVDRASSTERMGADPVVRDRTTIHFGGDGAAAVARSGDMVRMAVGRGAAPVLDEVFPNGGWEVNNER
jgi:hypothetical protein